MICDIIKKMDYIECAPIVLNIIQSADLKNQKTVDDINRLVEYLLSNIAQLRNDSFASRLLDISAEWPAKILYSVAGMFKQKKEWVCIGNLAGQVLQLKEQMGNNSIAQILHTSAQPNIPNIPNVPNIPNIPNTNSNPANNSTKNSTNPQTEKK
jgi:hypothetical protein